MPQDDRTPHPQFAALEARLIRQERELATLRQRLPRRRGTALARALAAVVVATLLLTPLGALAASFVDLNGGSPHNGSINAIADAGISRGCNANGTRYCPNDLVTREQMASFLARTAGLGGNPPIANAATAVNATNATNATTATNAQTATSATTAQSATNAAQLGGVPASGYLRPTGTLVYDIHPAALVRLAPSTTIALDPNRAVISSSIVTVAPVLVPLPVPNRVFGTPLRLASVTVCYEVSSSASFITTLNVFGTSGDGLSSLLFSDGEDLKSLDPTCYTATNGGLIALAGGPALSIEGNFTNTSHTITIYRVTATLVPVP